MSGLGRKSRATEQRRKVIGQLGAVRRQLEKITERMVTAVSVSAEEHSQALDAEMVLWRLVRQMRKGRDA